MLTARADLMRPTSTLIGPPDRAAVQDFVAGRRRPAGSRPADMGGEPVDARSQADPDRRSAELLHLCALGPVPSRRRPALGRAARRAERQGAAPDGDGDAEIASLAQAHAVRTPKGLEPVSDLTGGSMYHADMSLAQLVPWRPTLSLARYRTPIPGLWLTGAAAYPVGSVNGISGKLAAKAVLKAGRALQICSARSGGGNCAANLAQRLGCL